MAIANYPAVRVGVSKARVAELVFQPVTEGIQWAILSPDRHDVSQESNVQARFLLDNMLHTMLEDRWIVRLPVQGYYDGLVEQAWFIINIDLAAVIKLANLFNQDSFVFKTGLFVKSQITGLYVQHKILNRLVCQEDTRFSSSICRSVVKCDDGDVTVIVDI